MLSEASYHNMTVGRIPSVEGGIQPTIFDAKANLLTATANDTPAILAVGANDTVLTADSSTATGLKWASPSAGANFSLINTGGTTLTGASTTVSGISGANQIMVVLQNASGDAAVTDFRITLNGGASTFFYFTQWNKYSTVYAASDFDQDGGAGSTFIKFSRTPTAGSTTAGYILLTGCNAAGVKPFNYVSTVSGADAKIIAIGGGVYEGSSTISSITITPSGGNLDAGKIYIYTSA